MHPSRRGNVLSGGNNGYVMNTDFTLETPEHVLQQTGGFRFGTEEVLSEPVGEYLRAICVHKHTLYIYQLTIIYHRICCSYQFVRCTFGNKNSSCQYSHRGALET